MKWRAGPGSGTVMERPPKRQRSTPKRYPRSCRQASAWLFTVSDVNLESLRTRLSTHDPLLRAWTFLREPLAAEVASGAGYDYVCIDGQHGIHDYASIVGQLTAIAAGGTALPI